MAHLGTRSLKMTVDGDEVFAEVSNVRITSAESDSDFVSFEAASQGGARDYRLAFTAVQDPGTTDSLWNKVFTDAGSTVSCVLMPEGNPTPTPTAPHFTFSAVISEPDGDLLGGEANASASARFTFECEWELTAKPVKKTTA